MASRNKQTNKQTKIITVGENVEKMEHLYTLDGNVDWISHYEKYYVGSSKN